MVPALRPTRAGFRKMHEWLLSTMREEAARRSDGWTPGLYDGEKPGRLPPATVDSLNDYLIIGLGHGGNPGLAQALRNISEKLHASVGA